MIRRSTSLLISISFNFIWFSSKWTTWKIIRSLFAWFMLNHLIELIGIKLQLTIFKWPATKFLTTCTNSEPIHQFSKTGDRVLRIAVELALNHLYFFFFEHLNRKFVKVEIDRHRPAIGSCLGAFASTFPVAFLEPHLNNHNPFCIHGKLQEHSLEAQGNQTLLF